MTGDDLPERQLYPDLIRGFQQADRIDIIVSFMMESGVRMLIQEMKQAIDRGVRIRILTGNYLGITQPSALVMLKHQCQDHIDLRFYNEKNRSFHPKCSLFGYRDHTEVIIGSSNFSRSALTSGIEWNYRFSSKEDPASVQQFRDTFEDLFEHHSLVIDEKVLKEYSDQWHQPAVLKDIDLVQTQSEVMVPRGAQIEALCALDNSRKEGACKGLVHAATGIGKTVLAAFDSLEYHRILFVAHREEILKQAAETFCKVRGSTDCGFFDGQHKQTGASMIFASVATLGQQEYLNEKYFTPDCFDYIVIDEFHHAVTDQYQKIVSYFKPQFLLGLTATPERMDGRNIYELCDYNVPYEISLFDAINKGMLSPFHYYGIYDETDYSTVKQVRGKYMIPDLDKLYMDNHERTDMIARYYKKYGSDRALGFCCSRHHAERMAEEFCQRNIPSAAVYSQADGKYSMDREQAIDLLKQGKIKVIFSVDMFNEGVDIPDVDMVMFLRPTESPVIFLQQLGRGLRKAEGKKFLNVLDFIGNYSKAGRVRMILSGQQCSLTQTSMRNTQVPDGCMIDFDMKLIDLFEQMEKQKKPLKERIRQEYLKVEDQLGHRPTRIDLFTYMDPEIIDLCISNSQVNLFKDYFGFLNSMNRLTPQEQRLYDTVCREFFHMLETTAMSKVYKMPVLSAFIHQGKIRPDLTEKDLLASWKAFFTEGTNWKDLREKITREEYEAISDTRHIYNIQHNPVHFLIRSGKGFFEQKDGYAISLCDELKAYIQDPVFIGQMNDIIEYRTMDYYQRRYRDSSKLS